MPEMDGIAATKKTIKIDPKTDFLAITAYSSHVRYIIQAGTKEVLTKSIRSAELLKKIKKKIIKYNLKSIS